MTTLNTIRIRVRNHFGFNLKQFAGVFILWLVGICFNTVPILCNCIYEYLNNPDFFNLHDFFWSDQDLLFISFSTGFLLLFEWFFIRHQSHIVSRIIGGMLGGYSIALIITYVISIFSDEWNTELDTNIIIAINKWTLVGAVVFGFLFLLSSSVTCTRRVVNVP